MSTHPSRIHALVPAAGIGQRALAAGVATTAKQYRVLAGQSMLRHSVQALLADTRIAQVLVVVAPGDAQASVELQGLSRVRVLASGGSDRHVTVANGLARLDAAATDWVLVHDAARPGLAPERLAALIDAGQTDAVGALLALPAADTLKQVVHDNGQLRAARTLPRDDVWLAQTPQMFRIGLLREALAHVQATGVVPTDEASAIEALGHRPRLVPGHAENFKVTWPDDFSRMESWLLQCRRSA